MKIRHFNGEFNDFNHPIRNHEVFKNMIHECFDIIPIYPFHGEFKHFVYPTMMDNIRNMVYLMDFDGELM